MKPEITLNELLMKFGGKKQERTWIREYLFRNFGVATVEEFMKVPIMDILTGKGIGCGRREKLIKMMRACMVLTGKETWAV